MSAGTIRLRAAQARALAYDGGALAIAAVPGAGKTFVLVELVRRVIEACGAEPEQVLVLTYQRAAAATLRARLVERLGARAERLQVTTIHGYCHGLLLRHAGPELEVLPEPERARALRAALTAYMDDGQRRAAWLARGARDDAQAFDEGLAAAGRAIAAAKQHGLSLDALEAALAPLERPELAFVAREYAAALAARGALDFDDLVARALALLAADPAVRAHERARCRFVFEDEAQDSTPAQNRLLTLLAGEDGHLVRVGDPNQAITGSFSFTDPRYFRAFCERCAADGKLVRMDETGRSAEPILALANHLVARTAGHADAGVAAAFVPVAMRRAADAPPAAAAGVHFEAYPHRAFEKLQVLRQVQAHRTRHPEDRCAVLLPTNAQVRAYAALFAEAGLGPARAQDPVGGVLALIDAVLAALAAEADAPGGGPEQTACRAAALGAWWPLLGEGPVADHALRRAVERAWAAPSPRAEAPGSRSDVAERERALLLAAQGLRERLTGLASRCDAPPYDVIASLATAWLAHDARAHAAGLAWAEAASRAARGPDPLGGPAADWAEARPVGLAALSELFAEWRASGYRPAPGPDDEGAAVSIMTLHRAKGAEFDAVWLPQLGSYTYGRSQGPLSAFPWELAEVALRGETALLAQAAVEAASEPDAPRFEAAAILLAARRTLLAERLRLLYVGLTRARRHLFLSVATQEGRCAPPRHIQELAWLCGFRPRS